MTKLYSGMIVLLCALTLNISTSSAQEKQKENPGYYFYIENSFENEGKDRYFNYTAVNKVIHPTYARTGKASLLLHSKNSYSMIHSRLIPVKKNSTISVKVQALYPKRGNLVSKTLTYLGASALAYQTDKYLTPIGQSENGKAINRKLYPTFGFGLALAPELLKGNTKDVPKAYLRCITYDKDTNLIDTQIKLIDRNAKNNWQEISLNNKVVKNGYLQVTFVNESKKDVLVDDISLIIAKEDQAEENNENLTISTNTLEEITSFKGSIANTSNVQSNGECSPNDDCIECDPASACYNPGPQCLPEVPVDVCDPNCVCYDVCVKNTPCYDAYICSNGEGNCDTDPFQCICDPMYCDNNGDGDDDNGNDGGDNHGGEPNPNPNPNPNPDPPAGGGVIDHLTTPCFEAALSKLLDRTKTNPMNRLVKNNYSAGQGEINIFEEPVLMQNGKFIAAYTRIAPVGQTGYNITLSTGFLGSASQEEVAKTLMHEVIHAYIDEYGGNASALDQKAEHKYMFENFTNRISQSLMDLFPGTSQTDATAMAMMGYNDYTQNPNGTWNEAANNYALANFGMSLAQAKAISDQYLGGDKGTPCN